MGTDSTKRNRRAVATDASRADRSSMLRAMHVLEAALAKGVPACEVAWRQEVLSSATALAAAMKDQSCEFDATEGLLQQITLDAPRLSNRVDELRRFHHTALNALDQSISDITRHASTEALPTSEIRTNLANVLSTIRHLQASESDLIYEAYQVDLGGGD